MQAEHLLIAVNLALDAAWRFDGMPPACYRDWLRVAAEEAHRFSLLRELLKTMGYDYGDFPAHTGLWDMPRRTAGDVLARMALVPRTLGAPALRGPFNLDARRAAGFDEAELAQLDSPGSTPAILAR